MCVYGWIQFFVSCFLFTFMGNRYLREGGRIVGGSGAENLIEKEESFVVKGFINIFGLKIELF